MAAALEYRQLKDVPKQPQFGYDLSDCFESEAAFFVTSWDAMGKLLIQVCQDTFGPIHTHCERQQDNRAEQSKR